MAGMFRHRFIRPRTRIFIPSATVDVTAPVLSSPTGTETGATTASGTVSTDEGNGTLYFVVTQSATSPSVAQIQLGQDHTSSAADYDNSQIVGGTGTQNVTASGLVAATTYYLHYQHADAAANDSTVATSTSFTTDAEADTTPPNLSSPNGVASGTTTATGTVTTDEDNGTLYWVVTQSATTPSVAQIQLGQDHTGTAADDSDNQPIVIDGVQGVNATGLTAETTYYFHYQHQDTATNDSTVAASSSFTTSAVSAAGAGHAVRGVVNFVVRYPTRSR